MHELLSALSDCFSYMPKNRYTKSQRISEPDFIEILMGVLIGCTNSRIGELVTAKKTAISNHANKIIDRIISDESVSGWMRGGGSALPSDDDLFWSSLHECLVNCKSEQYSTAPCSAPHADYTDILASSEINKKRTAKVLAGSRKRKACENCKIAAGGVFNDLMRSFFVHYYLHEIAIRNPKENAEYKRAFLLASLRCNLFTANDRFAEHSLSSFVSCFLQSCEMNKV